MKYITSDLHIGHDRKFVFGPRGFDTIEEHDQTILKNWNNKIKPDDEVYILGDLFLGNKEYGMNILKQLNGKFHVIGGNHDTDNKIELIQTLPQFIDFKWADVIKYHANNGKTYHLHLSHWFTETCSLEKTHLTECIIGLYGHTHQKEKFKDDMPFYYNVGLDAHNMEPVSFEEIIEDCIAEVQKCKNLL